MSFEGDGDLLGMAELRRGAESLLWARKVSARGGWRLAHRHAVVGKIHNVHCYGFPCGSPFLVTCSAFGLRCCPGEGAQERTLWTYFL